MNVFVINEKICYFIGIVIMTSLCIQVQSLGAQLLLLRDPSVFNPNVIAFDYDEIYRAQNQPPEKHVIKVENGSLVSVVVYNSLAYQRTGCLCVCVCVILVLVVCLYH